MSERDQLAVKLLDVLSNSGRPYTTLELAKAVGLTTRKEVNPTLYALQDQRKVRLVNRQPPTWQLASSGDTAESGSMRVPGRPQPTASSLERGAWFGGRGRGQSRPTVSVPPAARTHLRVSNSDLDEQFTSQVVQFLRGSFEPKTALEISKALGTHRKATNQVLYHMEAERIVVKTEGGGPPRWSLSSQREDDFVRVQPRTQQQQRGLYTSPLPPALPVPPSSSSSMAYEASESYDDMPPLITEGNLMETVTPPTVGESAMETDGHSPYVSTAVDLSTIPPNDVHGRLIAVMKSDTSVLRTDLELAKAIGEGYTRSQVRPCLEELAQRGQVQMLQTMPPKWCLATSSPSSDPNTPIRTGVQQGSVAAFTPNNPSTSTLANITEMNRNPVSALSEHCQAIKANLTFAEVREYGPPHRKHFVIAAKFGNHSFEAESTSKKEAKRMAADLALQTVRANQTSVPSTVMEVVQPVVPGSRSGLSTPSSFLANRFADRIARMSQEFYLQCQQTIEFPQPGRKVVAAFVMEDTDTGQLSVVSLGSGTRCITGDQMSLEGLVVNDSHAEVVARRSLLRFFYRQLEIHHKGNDETVFTKSVCGPTLAKVRENIKFHLYISTAPCGDGAQFSRGDEENRDPPPDSIHCPTVTNKLQGVLRTKMEGGEGTIPIGDAQPQTWDGIMHGARLRTMSCSDKLGRWNVLGLQGSLLSNFMEPIYMSSLSLGSLHHHGHLARAVCCRFSELEQEKLLPPGFQVNHPCLDRVQGGDQLKRHTEKTSNFSMNWSLGDERAELNDGGNGRPVPPPGALRSQLSTTCSRITKASLYALFLHLCKVANRTELLSARTYRDTKELSTDFQRAKRSMYKVCENKGYGVWMKKPLEQEQFDSSVLERVTLNV